MAFQTQWYFSSLPKKVVDLLEKDLSDDSTLPATNWICGYIWHYIGRVFKYNMDRWI